MDEPNPAKPAQARSSRHDRALSAISGRDDNRSNLVSLDQLAPKLVERIRVDHPTLAPGALISRGEAASYRRIYVEELLQAEHGELTELDRQVAESLANQDTITENIDAEYEVQRTVGERLSDHLADFGGSWAFILWFMVALAVWIGFNQVASDAFRFDPYPYILLNLILSCVAALQDPIIMMSQKRQDAKDRLRSQNDYEVNLKAELEIRHLHEKMDYLMSRQWQRLAEIPQMQLDILQDISRERRREVPGAGSVGTPCSELREHAANRL
ncbi:DUF1003 domain-containing protein [Bradyrhizobium sp. LB11.1]|uniref:DUF1003 domain-containing protein n=1 Tax=Bradyrhizobium sp. LB11.1 TaxID=3156326 RepID=UPI003395154A